jgi:hypothetical protein
MIDLTSESPISLAQAAKLVPPGRNGKKTHLSTILRWILHGAKAPNGELVRLDGARLGGRWLTSKEALQRFSERLTPTLGGPPTTNGVHTARARERAAERAGRELELRGI